MVNLVKWVTRQLVHVDRTACPWLIKEFVDPQAEFIFVPTEKVEEISTSAQAIPYDMLNAELGHHGEKCSFDAIIEKYGITDPAVLELAKIVRAADTNKLASIPEAAGLEAIMTGIGMQTKDDYEAIQRASTVYDALYSNCRLKIMRDLHKAEIEKMDRRTQREFLKKLLSEGVAKTADKTGASKWP